MPALFRADHIGSFLRPAELLEARRSATSEQLRRLEDQHIQRVLAKQTRARISGGHRWRVPPAKFHERFHGRRRRI